MFKNFSITNITKIFEISKFFQTFFKENHRFGTMERTWYSDRIRQWRTYCSSSLQKFQHYTNLNCCHLLTNTPLLYPYSISNQNQTDPYIQSLSFTGGSEGSRTLVFNPFLIISTSCALREQRESNPHRMVNSHLLDLRAILPSYYIFVRSKYLFVYLFNSSSNLLSLIFLK